MVLMGLDLFAELPDQRHSWPECIKRGLVVLVSAGTTGRVTMINKHLFNYFRPFKGLK